jgi:hypothetical protein
MNTRSLNTLSVGVALCVAPTFLAQSSTAFKGMGPVPGAPPGYLFSIRAISDEGDVFGQAYGPAGVWSAINGYQSLKGLIPEDYAIVQSCTPSGELLFGIAATGLGVNDPEVPVIWKSRTQPCKPLPGFPPNWTSSGAYCNASGSVVAGYAYDKKIGGPKGIFIYRAGVRKNGGWEFITQWPAGTAYALIYDLNDDGTIGFGGSAAVGLGFEAIRWSKWDGLTLMGDLPGGTFESSFNNCDAAGRVAVGDGSIESGPRAARWTARTGLHMVEYPTPEWLGSYMPQSDGSGWVHGGDVGVPNVPGGSAMLWNPVEGMRLVKEILLDDYNLQSVKDWKLNWVSAISPNGRFITGVGKNPQGVQETWWAEIRPFCYADCDNASTPKGGPPVLDIDDFICYMTHFALDDLYANCNNDAELDIDDFICFQTAYALGC